MPFSMIWPVGLIVLSNIFYHICAKQSPENIDPLASLTVTYLVGAISSLILYFALNKGHNLVAEYSKLNWAPFVLGISIVGLEAGFIYLYKAGWAVNTGQLVTSVLLSIALIFVGYLLYKEQITTNMVIGIVLCLIGLYFINKH